jgi:hypothetical protein
MNPAAPFEHPIAASRHHGITVVRDDIIPGGTKTRAVDAILDGLPPHVAYAGPAYGYAQIALAHGARLTHRTAHIFTASRHHPHPNTTTAAQAGARIHEIAPGYLSQTQHRANAWAAEAPAERAVLPFGFDSETFRTTLARRIRTALEEAAAAPGPLRAVTGRLAPYRADELVAAITDPAEVWVAAGSGTLTRTLQDVYPNADHHAILVGKQDADIGQAEPHHHPQPFEQAARRPPPYPSTANYDAKVWEHVADRAIGDGVVIWNVAG